MTDAAAETKPVVTVEEIGREIYRIMTGGLNPDWPVGVDRLGYHQEPYVAEVPSWRWQYGRLAERMHAVMLAATSSASSHAHAAGEAAGIERAAKWHDAEAARLRREADAASDGGEGWRRLTCEAIDHEGYVVSLRSLKPEGATHVERDAGWLATELGSIDADVARWPDGLKQSFASHTPLTAPPVDRVQAVAIPNIADTAARALLDALNFDNCGELGRGGNGGLISRETMRKADALRMALDEAERGPFELPPVGSVDPKAIEAC